MISGRRKAGSTFSSTLLIDRQLILRVAFQCDQYVFYKNRHDQCLNHSLVSEFDREIGLNYLRAMRLSDSKSACNSKEDYHENIGL